MLRLAVAAASVALLVILFSTGTNEPGKIVFDSVYGLPFGWLLREPGRFLMLAALAYAVLVAAVTQALMGKLSIAELIKQRRPIALARLSYVPLSIGTALALGFPSYTGAIVPDQRPLLPSAHVQVPGYWKEMAQFVDKLPTQGAVLVMPPDDFYQMPYSWGYYGNDSFLVELFHRNVLVPNEQGYVPTSPQLVNSVKLAAQSILRSDWLQTESLVAALDSPLILVRRDVTVPFAGRPILPPDDITRALRASPNFILIHQVGALDLFALNTTLRETEFGAAYVTIDDQAPDLSILSVVPPGTALVSGAPQPGMKNVVQAPPLDLWRPEQSSLVWRTSAPSGWRYRMADLDSRAMVTIASDGASANLSQAQIAYLASGSDSAIVATVKGSVILPNGDFTRGPWGPISDCAAVDPMPASPFLSQTLVANGAPGGLPALRLSSTGHSACTSQDLAWHRGPVVLTLMIHPVEGAGPRICLWEVGLDRCAPTPSPPNQGGWFDYRTTVVPDAGTTGLRLFLYADVYNQGRRTTNEYADVRAFEVPSLPRFALLAEPERVTSDLQLVLIHSSFSTWWQGKPIGKHVLVDGMLNGWLIPARSTSFTASYTPATAVSTAPWISIATLGGLLAFLVWPKVLDLIRKRGHTRWLAKRYLMNDRDHTG
jgi:arabinofuranan 3-O-arabinosyltransferase